MRRRGLRGRPRFWGMVIFSQYEAARWAIDGNCLVPLVMQGWGLYWESLYAWMTPEFGIELP